LVPLGLLSASWSAAGVPTRQDPFRHAPRRACSGSRPRPRRCRASVPAWNTWLQRRAASFANVGHRFGPGRRITNHTTDEFSLASNPANGFSVIVAEHIDAAEQLLEGCPIVDSITLYQALTPESEHNI
jgi:hypothetical protein